MTAKTTISGKDLKAKLLSGGFSTKVVADAMGLRPQNLYAYYKSSAIQRSTLERIAAAIGEPAEFFTGKTVAATPLSGKQLQNKLKRSGIPIARLAESIGVTTQNVYAIFHSRKLREVTINTLMKATGKPREWFYTYNLPEDEKSKDELITALKEIIENQKKYIAYLEARIGVKL